MVKNADTMIMGMQEPDRDSDVLAEVLRFTGVGPEDPGLSKFLGSSIVFAARPGPGADAGRSGATGKHIGRRKGVSRKRAEEIQNSASATDSRGAASPR